MAKPVGPPLFFTERCSGFVIFFTRVRRHLSGTKTWKREVKRWRLPRGADRAKWPYIAIALTPCRSRDAGLSQRQGPPCQRAREHSLPGWTSSEGFAAPLFGSYALRSNLLPASQTPTRSRVVATSTLGSPATSSTSARFPTAMTPRSSRRKTLALAAVALRRASTGVPHCLKRFIAAKSSTV